MIKEFGEGGILWNRLKGNHKAAVGPRERFDVIGQHQFNLLRSQGLKESHHLLDVGCGSLRLGKFVIPWLNRNHYYGVEPNEWLIDAGIENELGFLMSDWKLPRFFYFSDFKLSRIDRKFDFIIANSIFTHAGIEQTCTCLIEASQVLKEGGKFLASVMLGKEDSYEVNAWRYHGFSIYMEESFMVFASAAGFDVKRLEDPHPGGHTWFCLEITCK